MPLFVDTERFFAEQIPDSVPERLYLLDDFRREQVRADLSQTHVLFIQHHLGPFIPRIGAMLEDRLDPNRCWFVDIPYSTYDGFHRDLGSIGVVESHVPPLSNPLSPYRPTQLSRVTQQLVAIAEAIDAGEKLLVVDDGAYFVRALAKVSESQPWIVDKLRGRVSIVEQTTRGHRHLESEQYGTILAQIGAPAVSVARCRTKTDVEGPFIGVSVARAVERSLGELAGRTLLIGYGVVGEAVHTALHSARICSRIDVVDLDEATRRRARDAGSETHASLPQDREYDTVIGCTGYTSLKLNDRHLLADNAQLISCSSAAIEFNRDGFVEAADAYPDDQLEVVDRDTTEQAGIHADIRLRTEHGHITFTNAGFPINFDGRIESLPARVIQPTHALLYAASVQALTETSVGLINLAVPLDEWIGTASLAYINDLLLDEPSKL